MVTRERRTTGEWEAELGAQVRRARLLEDVSQASLARTADISIGALRNLEAGHGSSVQTLVRVLRALRRTDWLESLEPAPEISPIAMARALEGLKEPRRATPKRRDT